MVGRQHHLLYQFTVIKILIFHTVIVSLLHMRSWYVSCIEVVFFSYMMHFDPWLSQAMAIGLSLDFTPQEGEAGWGWRRG